MASGRLLGEGDVALPGLMLASEVTDCDESKSRSSGLIVPKYLSVSLNGVTESRPMAGRRVGPRAGTTSSKWASRCRSAPPRPGDDGAILVAYVADAPGWAWSSEIWCHRSPDHPVSLLERDDEFVKRSALPGVPWLVRFV